MKNRCLPIIHLLYFSLFAMSSSAALAGEYSGSMYAGIELGVFVPQDLDTMGADDDVPTSCDTYLFTVDAARLNSPECARGQDQWFNNFDLGTGVIGGATIGYQRENMRFELEYLYRAGSGDTSNLGIVNSKVDEFLIDTESLDSFRAHHLFANVYYDFHNQSKFTPYLGAGVGWADTKMDYKVNFVRNTRQVFENDPNLRARAPAAGTLTNADKEFSDELFGYQILAGIDYRLEDNLSIGAKIRYAEFEELEGGGQWDLLRSHDSRVGPDGDIVTYQVELDEMKFWAASVAIKYHF